MFSMTGTSFNRQSANRFLRRLFVDGHGRVLGRPLYHATTGLELAVQRALDGLQRSRPDTTWMNKQLTAVIKTFERPAALQRLLTSMQRLYPGLPIIVMDDSREPGSYPGTLTIPLPYDSGISAGRNAGLRHVSTPYVLLLDDDFIFYRHSGLAQALTLLQGEPRIDIMGGAVLDLPFFHAHDYANSTLYPTKAQPVLPPGSRLAGLPVYDKVPNFFLARSERLRLVPWDENLKLLEHAEFFTRAKGVLTTVYNARLRCLHVKSFFDTAYLAKRNDTAMAEAYLLWRYYGAARPPGQGDEQPGHIE
jgi:glycosyltransferase involved in cell wall biosynthesis